MVTQPGRLLASDGQGELCMSPPVYDHLGPEEKTGFQRQLCFAFQGAPLTGGIPACFEGEEGAVGHGYKEDLPVCGPHHAVTPMHVPL